MSAKISTSNASKPLENSSQRLGRGLSSLLGDFSADSSAHSEEPVRMLAIGQIFANPQQPRRNFSSGDIDELADSFQQTGILQPILVTRRDSGDGYQIVAGERRWRAAQQAGLHSLPAIIKDLTSEQSLQISIIENIQRQDLNPIEEATAYAALIQQGQRQQDIALLVSKSRSYVANMVRLLQLPTAVQNLLRQGQLTAGHARLLVGHPHADWLGAEIVRRRLSVRQVEDLLKHEVRHSPDSPKDDTLSHLEKQLGDLLGVPAKLSCVQQRYNLQLKFSDASQLGEFIEFLRRAK